MNHKLTYDEMVKELKLYTLTDIIAMFYEARTGNSKMENHIDTDLYNRITSINKDLETAITQVHPLEPSQEPKKDLALPELIDLRNEILKATDSYINHLRRNHLPKSKSENFFRIHKGSNNYSVINDEVLYHKKLSSTAKAIFAYINCLPIHIDPTFENIASSFNDTDMDLKNGLKELIKHGYIQELDNPMNEVSKFIKHIHNAMDAYLTKYYG